MIVPAILAGGAGTRLWPASRESYPKQFAPLTGTESLFQATLRRFGGPGFDRPLVMTADAYRFMATEQAAAVGLTDARVVVEPCPRDTGPAILAAALIVAEDDPDTPMLIAPSDHAIADTGRFHEAVEQALEALKAGATGVTFGVTPDRPETAYGYLEVDPQDAGEGPLELWAFREKPDAATAERFVAGGRHLWNAGLYLFRARDLIAAFDTHAPYLTDPCRRAVAEGAQDLTFFRLAPAAYREAKAISFDYAVMESISGASVIALDSGWSDLGSWSVLWEISERDADGVATVGDVTAIDCRDSYLRSEEPSVRLVGMGLDSVVAVAMRDAVLVADRDRAQDVREAVDQLRAAGVPQADSYPRFHRPWGWYETLCREDRFQVKRVMVRPGGSLSLQSHVHRSEHWVVVSGTARTTIGDEVRLVSENEGVYIPLGTVHRLENPGHVPMYLIEVQTGAYLGEDDVTRYEDAYARE